MPLAPALFGANTMSVALPGVISVQVLPESRLRQTPPTLPPMVPKAAYTMTSPLDWIVGSTIIFAPVKLRNA